MTSPLPLWVMRMRYVCAEAVPATGCAMAIPDPSRKSTEYLRGRVVAIETPRESLVALLPVGVQSLFPFWCAVAVHVFVPADAAAALTEISKRTQLCTPKRPFEFV